MADVDDADRVAVRVGERDALGRRRRHAGVDARGAVVDAALLGGEDDLVLGMRRVVGAADDDHQLRGVGQAGRVDDLVGEDDVERGAFGQADDGVVLAVDVEAEGAVGVDGQAAEVLGADDERAAAGLGVGGEQGYRGASHRGQGADGFDAACDLAPVADAVDLQHGARLVGAVDVQVDAVAARVVDATGAAGEQDDVAGRVALRPGVGLRGLGSGLVVAGHRVVVVAADGDAQFGQVVQAQGVGDLVAEVLDQRVVGSQALHRGIGVVDHVAVGAVGGDGQGAVGAGDDGGAGARHGGQGPGHGLAQGANAGQRLGVAGIDVGVVGQHVAGGIGAGYREAGGRGVVGLAGVAVVDPAPLGGEAFVVDPHRRVVGALDAHPQGSGRLQRRAADAEVLDDVGEVFRQRSTAGEQGLHGRIVVVDDVLVGAAGRDHQFAVAALHLRGADVRHVHRRTAEGRGDRDDIQPVAVGGDIDVEVVVQQVAARVDARQAVGGAAGLHGGGAVVDGGRRVVDREQADDQEIAVGARVAQLAGDAVAVEVAVVAQVVGDHFEEVEAVVVEVAQVVEAGEGVVDSVDGADQNNRCCSRRRI
ncbi:hypothetical protein D9M69_308920 [compost metagenome]